MLPRLVAFGLAGAGMLIGVQPLFGELPPPPAPPPPLRAPSQAPSAPAAPGGLSAPTAPVAPPAPAAPQPGPWKVLFDGKTITGLRGVQKPDFLKAGWKIEDGALVLPKEVKQSGRMTGGDLVTTEAYSDFEFQFEWKLTVSADTGILYLARAGLGQKPVGCEFQIIDDLRNPVSMKGGPIKRTGALFGVLPASEQRHVKDDEWNMSMLRIRGNQVEHFVNGHKVLEYQLGSRELQAAARAHKPPLPASFGTKFKSPILILDQGEEVSFRNLRIRTIPPS